MSTDFSQVVQSALSLPQTDRAKLASALLRSLDPEAHDDPELIAEEWEKVILARSDALHRGEVQFLDGEEVISELREMTSKRATTSKRTMTSEPKSATDQ